MNIQGGKKKWVIPAEEGSPLCQHHPYMRLIWQNTTSHVRITLNTKSESANFKLIEQFIGKLRLPTQITIKKEIAQDLTYSCTYRGEEYSPPMKSMLSVESYNRVSLRLVTDNRNKSVSNLVDFRQYGFWVNAKYF